MFLVEEVYKLDQSKRWNPTFQMINLETRKHVENITLKAAKQPTNRNFNRYRDVLPYDHSRVVLESGDVDYINANYVNIPGVKRKYILTQGPLPHTCEHFWKMIWEQESTVIIMLNKIIEKNAVKCHPYWPMGEEEVIEFGDFRVQNKSEVMASAYVIRDLQLDHIPSGKTRTIQHFHYIMWPDFGVPSSPTAFLTFLEDVIKSGTLEEDARAPVIHCSAGIGRSGTFCLVDSALSLVKNNGKINELDLKQMLISLRKCRIGLIQTPDQLRFSYLAIIQGLFEEFPDEFKSEHLPFPTQVSEKKRKQSAEGEPPPLPPRKRTPQKSPRKQEPDHGKESQSNDLYTSHDEDDTVAQEDERQKKLVQSMQKGVDESSEGSEPDEVLDLSDSEEDHLESVEAWRRSEPRAQEDAQKDVWDAYPVNKPLPPLPSEDQDESETEFEEPVDNQPKLLPVLSAEEEDVLEGTLSKTEGNHSIQEGTLTKPEVTPLKPEENHLIQEGTLSKLEGTPSKPEENHLIQEGTLSKQEGIPLKPEENNLIQEGILSKPEGTPLKPEENHSIQEGTLSKPEGTPSKPEENHLKQEDTPLKLEDTQSKLEGTLLALDKTLKKIEKRPKLSSETLTSRIINEPISKISNNENQKCNIKSKVNNVGNSMKESTEDSKETKNGTTVGSKANESPELRHRQHNERCKETEQRIQTIKKNIHEEELRKNNHSFNIKLTAVLGISAGLLLLYYKFVI